MNTHCILIKKYLEQKYDLPFLVNYKEEYSDPVYKIIPENDSEELFEIRMMFRQNIRMIIEIQPQKYAAEMLKDIQKAREEKRETFLKYIELFRKKDSKVEIQINQQSRNMEDKSVWDQSWKKFKIRATKILAGEMEKDDITSLAVEWAGISVGMMLTLLNVEYFSDGKRQCIEGGIQKALVTRYERNPANREQCLATNGYLCNICGFNFEKVYGELGQHFIHVHHIEKISSFDGTYYLDPTKDLIPICPNCHAMLHRLDPPMDPIELRHLIKEVINRD